MKPIRILATILLTVKVTFAAVDSVSSLKLIDAGVPKDKLALLVVPLVPLQIILPLVISKYTNGPRPMDVYIRSIPYRMLFAIIATLIVWLAPLTLSSTGQVPIYFYVMLLVNYAFYQVCLYSMFVAVMAFFAKISDPAVGGTYMTMLNTVCNLGGNWPTAIVLWLVDVLTWRNCVGADADTENLCADKAEQDVSVLEPPVFKIGNMFSIILFYFCSIQTCKGAGGICETSIDGYYLECVLCIIYGLGWYYWAKSRIRHLQRLPLTAWRVVHSKESQR